MTDQMENAPEPNFSISHTAPLCKADIQNGFADVESKTTDTYTKYKDTTPVKLTKTETDAKPLTDESAQHEEPKPIFKLVLSETDISDKLVQSEVPKSDTFTEAEVEASDYRTTKITNITICSITKPTGPLARVKSYHKRLDKDADGTERDVDVIYLKKVFEKQTAAGLRRVNIQQDVEYEKFIKTLKEDKTLLDYDSFLFIFLTHLDKTDSGLCEPKIHFQSSTVSLTQLQDDLKTIEAMFGKPKVILVQADCRCMEVNKHAQGYQPREEEEVKYKTIKIPTDADVLVMTSTLPREHSAPASMLVQAFSDMMDMNLNRVREEQEDFLTLTVNINARFQELFKKVSQQDVPLPLVTSTLRKRLYL